MDASYHRHDCRDNETSGAGLLRITAVLSMQFLGYCELEPPGMTCPRLREVGQCSSKVHPLVQKRCLGKTPGNSDR